MILHEYACPHCGEPAIDSLDHCHLCKQPYTGTLSKITRAYHETKLMLTTRCRTPEEVEWCHSRLRAVLEGLAVTEKMGVAHIADFLVVGAFDGILYEQV